MIKTKDNKFVLREGHQVQEVFEIDGVKYYEFVDSNMAPCNRMFTAMAYYNELQMRCDKDYLTAHCQAVRDILNPKDGEGLNLLQLSKLTLQLQERLEWIIEPETVYNYASVVIFDESESPYEYDMKYNREVKIPIWKKEDKANFFLRLPVKRLFPALDISHSDLQEYLKIQAKMDKAHLVDIFTTLSKGSQTKDWYLYLKSRSQEEQPLVK